MSRLVHQRLHEILAACDFIIRHTASLALDDCRPASAPSTVSATFTASP